jgi:CRP/FNR family transcriptional regulator
MAAFDVAGELVLDAPVAPQSCQAAASACACAGEVLGLEPYELLFSAGQRREWAYRIEEGAICVFRLGPHGFRDVVEFAVQGDLVGLGCLDRHVDSAEAVDCARVSLVSLDEVHELARQDVRVRARLEQAISREIELRRDSMVAAGRRAPLERVAALLSVIYSNNCREGREPTLVPDTLECGIVADMLGMSVEALAGHLVELSRLGLVRPSACGGLRLLDVGKLEEMAQHV